VWKGKLMVIYKIIDCYAGDEKVYFAWGYNVYFKQLKIFGGHCSFSTWVKYIFHNSSLTQKGINKKLDKIRIERILNRKE